METVGAICNKPLDKIKSCEELKEKNDLKTQQKRLSWDGTLQSRNECPLDGLVKNDEIEFEPISNIEEVFRDPSTFDFLSQIGSCNPLRDLRKESLYVKFDPCLQSPKEENSSPVDSKLSKRSVFHISDLVTSSSDRHTNLVNLHNELPLPDLCLVEPLKTSTLEKKPDEFSISNISNISTTQSSENITLVDIETTDKSVYSSKQYALQTSILEKKPKKCSISNFSETESSENIILIDIEPSNRSIEKSSSLQRELFDLRALVVERELAHREKKKNLEKILQNCLQQKLIQDAISRKGQNDLDRAIIAEYEENLNSIKLEITTAAIIFQQKRKELEAEKNRVMEHKIMTDKAHEDLSVKLCNTEKSIISLSQEMEEEAHEITRIKLLTDTVNEKMAKHGWEFAHAVDGKFKDIECQKQKMKKELGLLETRIKTLKVKENSLNLRLGQVTAENEYLTKMLDDATKEQK